MERTFVRCYLHQEGDPFYVLVEAQASAAQASRFWPALEAACAEARYTVVEAE